MTIMFLFVITSLPLCTLNSRLALNFLNSSDSKICKTFIRNDVVDDNFIGDDGDYVDDDNVIDDNGEDLIGDDGSEVDGHVINEERTKTMMCLAM